MSTAERWRQRTKARQPMPRLFTVQQANRALPLVRRIVADIMGQHRALERLLRRRGGLARLHRQVELEPLDRRAARVIARLNALIEEVNAIGCELKDWQTGQVDFRSLREGREVCLCWKPGEESIGYWHEVMAGSAAREPLDVNTSRCAPVPERLASLAAAQDAVS